jgi:ubiquinone/menaquinone biosynthesis C-methylase UbiE
MTDTELALTTDTAFWDRIAEKYAAQPVADPAAFDRKIAITKSRMRPEHEVLDVGCGTGSLALRLAPFARHVHGLDVSSEMMRIARGKVEAAGIANVTFHVGAFDERFAAIAPGTLDGLCAYSILHLVPDRRAALARMFALLKPGGFFVSSTVCLGESWVPYAPLIGVMRFFGRAPRVSSFSKAELGADMRAAGFVDVESPDVGAKSDIAFFVATKPSI